MFCKSKTEFDELHHINFSNWTFSQEFSNEWIWCNNASNANWKHGPNENNESSSQNDGSISSESAYICIRNPSKLSVYEEKALLFQMLTSQFSGSKSRSRLTLTSEFIDKIYFWTAKIETQGYEIETLLHILDKRASIIRIITSKAPSVWERCDVEFLIWTSQRCIKPSQNSGMSCWSSFKLRESSKP